MHEDKLIKNETKYEGKYYFSSFLGIQNILD